MKPLPVANNQLSVRKRKRRVETGDVRIRTIVKEHHEWIQDVIERVKVDSIADSHPVTCQKDDVLITPAVEEVVENRLLRRTRSTCVRNVMLIRSQSP